MAIQFYHRPLLVNIPNELDCPAQITEALIPLLDGSHSLEEVFGELLVAGFEVEPIFTALSWLDQQGFIEESPTSEINVLSGAEKERYKEQMEFFASIQPEKGGDLSSWPVAGIAAQVALKQSLVVLTGLDMVGSYLALMLAMAGVGHLIGTRVSEKGTAESSLEGAGSRLVSQASIQRVNPFVEFMEIEQVDDLPVALREAKPTLFIYCPDQFSGEFCERLNEICLSGLIPLLPYRRRLFEIEIGPLVIPRETACYVCYDRRRKAVRSDSERLSTRTPSPPRLNFPIGTDWLTLEVVKFLTGVAEPITQGRLCRLNTLSGIIEVHSVLKLPRCPACGVHRNRPLRRFWEE